MQQEYTLTLNENTSRISLRIPDQILKDLVAISSDNGTDIEIEIIMRLARTLERNYEMQEQDEALAFLAYEKCIEKNISK